MHKDLSVYLSQIYGCQHSFNTTNFIFIVSIKDIVS